MEVELPTDSKLLALFIASMKGWSLSPQAFLVEMMPDGYVTTFSLLKFILIGIENVLQPCTTT